MQFLTSVESSLLPYGMLDPPLWSERKQKEDLRTISNDKQKQSKEEKGEKTEEKAENVKNGDSEEIDKNSKDSNIDETENKSPSSKKSKRMFPFSLSRRKKEVIQILLSLNYPYNEVLHKLFSQTRYNVQFNFLKEKDDEETKDESEIDKEHPNGDDSSRKNQESMDSMGVNKPQMSVMDPIDTVFKIVNLAPVGGSMSNLNVPGQQQPANGSLLNPDVAGVKNSTPSFLSKSRTSEWFANLFSPSKSRNNSSSTDTSRFVTISFLDMRCKFVA